MCNVSTKTQTRKHKLKTRTQNTNSKHKHKHKTQTQNTHEIHFRSVLGKMLGEQKPAERGAMPPVKNPEADQEIRRDPIGGQQEAAGSSRKQQEAAGSSKGWQEAGITIEICGSSKQRETHLTAGRKFERRLLGQR
jgi:hypothetical protein